MILGITCIPVPVLSPWEECCMAEWSVNREWVVSLCHVILGVTCIPVPALSPWEECGVHWNKNRLS